MSSQAFDSTDIDDLYSEIILDHYRNPRNQSPLAEPDIETEGINPFCGDEVVIQIGLTGDLIESVSFKGSGCSISQASASILTERIRGTTLEEAEILYYQFRDLMHGKETSERSIETLGEIEALTGVRKFPIRIKCALLAWSALEDGIKPHIENRRNNR